MLMDVKTLPPLRQGRILSYSLDERRCNFSVDQLYDDIVLRIRTGEDQRPREIPVEKLFEQNAERRFFLAIVYDGNALSVFVDGERIVRQKLGTIDYDSWDKGYPLVLGSHPNGKYPWKGIFYHLTILDRTVTAETLKNARTLFQDAAAVLQYSFDEQNGTTVIDHGMLPPAPITVPAGFRPYERMLLQSPRDYWPEPRRPHLRDILANLIMYLPVGYLMALLVGHRHGSTIAVVAPILFALGMSFAIEVLQAYLPSRNSSTVDVLVNGLGSYLGVLAHHGGWVERMLVRFNISFGK
jgi:VanZ family protein